MFSSKMHYLAKMLNQSTIVYSIEKPKQRIRTILFRGYAFFFFWIKQSELNSVFWVNSAYVIIRESKIINSQLFSIGFRRRNQLKSEMLKLIVFVALFIATVVSKNIIEFSFDLHVEYSIKYYFHIFLFNKKKFRKATSVI